MIPSKSNNSTPTPQRIKGFSSSPNENVEVGAYTAHVIWLEMTKKF